MKGKTIFTRFSSSGGPHSPKAGRVLRAAALAGVLFLLAACATAPFSLEEPEGTLGGQMSKREKAKDYFRQSRFGLAEENFRALLSQNPDDGEAWLGLAAAYDRLGRFDLADRAYERTLSVAGRRLEVLNNLGYSYYLRGDKARARAMFQEALRQAPDHPVLKANLALLQPQS